MSLEGLKEQFIVDDLSERLPMAPGSPHRETKLLLHIPGDAALRLAAGEEISVSAVLRPHKLQCPDSGSIRSALHAFAQFSEELAAADRPLTGDDRLRAIQEVRNLMSKLMR